MSIVLSNKWAAETLKHRLLNLLLITAWKLLGILPYIGMVFLVMAAWAQSSYDYPENIFDLAIMAFSVLGACLYWWLFCKILKYIMTAVLGCNRV